MGERARERELNFISKMYNIHCGGDSSYFRCYRINSFVKGERRREGGQTYKQTSIQTDGRVKIRTDFRLFD